MPMKAALESALDHAADTPEAWTAAKNIFWRQLQEEDAPLIYAINRALIRACEEDKTRRKEARDLFFRIYHGSGKKPKPV